MKRETDEWIERAAGDWKVAQRDMQTADPVWNVVCFLGQQCAETIPQGRVGRAQPRFSENSRPDRPAQYQRWSAPRAKYREARIGDSRCLGQCRALPRGPSRSPSRRRCYEDRGHGANRCAGEAGPFIARQLPRLRPNYLAVYEALQLFRDATLACIRTHREQAERAWRVDLNDGVRVNLTPLQRAGLLAGAVLKPADAKKAIADRAR